MHPTPPEPHGRVSRVDRGICDVLTPAGSTRARWSAGVSAEASHSPDAVPCVGDEVLLRLDGDQTWLDSVLPRRNAVTRASVEPGSSKQQVLAANVDVLAICEPCHPAPAAGRIERLLALAWECSAQPAVLLTKADLDPDVDRTAADVRTLALGAIVLPVSVASSVGVDVVGALTSSGQALALLGTSGAGKSTLLNALLGYNAMEVSHVRDDGKGRHTTAHRELHVLDDGSYVIDTPGLRSIGLASTDGLDQVFAEIGELAESCRFTDCEHRTEPGCTVLAAIESGALPPRRLDSYRRLLREAAYQERRGDARLAAAERARWKALNKQMRQPGHNRP